MKLEPLLSNSSPLIRQLAWTQLRRIQAIHNKNQEIIEAYAAKQEKEKH